jgi:hypothetical protein
MFQNDDLFGAKPDASASGSRGDWYWCARSARLLNNLHEQEEMTKGMDHQLLIYYANSLCGKSAMPVFVTESELRILDNKVLADGD